MKIILHYLPLFFVCMAKVSLASNQYKNNTKSSLRQRHQVKFTKNDQEESHTTTTSNNVELHEFSSNKKSSGIIERKLVAPAVIAAMIGAGAATVSAGVAIANLISDEAAANGSADGFQRGSLVASFTARLFHEIQAYAPDARRTVVVVLANLEYEISYSEGGYIGSATIANWGYNVYAVSHGWIRNDGGRGYENWSVYGYMEQHDNLITIE
jgi:hypothetical protein